jgi:hypothetical protein
MKLAQMADASPAIKIHPTTVLRGRRLHRAFFG